MDAQIQLRDNHTVNVRIFDTTAALDDTISDMARGLLLRVRALAYLHMEQYGSFNLTIEQLASGSPDGIEAIRACLRELSDRGYVRRWKEDGHWIVELSVVPVTAESVVPVLDNPPPKKTRKPKTSNSRPIRKTTASVPAKKSKFHPEYRKAIIEWLQAPTGGDYVVTSKEWSRVNMSINTILELAAARGWIVQSDGDEVFESVDTHDLLIFIAACWQWIKEESPYRGKQDIYNVANRLQEWWSTEGKKRYENQSNSNAYTPMMI